MPTANLLRKSFSLELKADSEGAFKARIATLNVVDSDGDVSIPGSFPDGKRVLISAYQHTSWYGEMPVGDGVIGSNDKEAWIEGKFWTDTEAGMQTYLVVKNAADLQEWSYGYEILNRSTDAGDLESFPGAYQIIEKQDVFECSPVLIGAGVNTGTEYIKSLAEPYSDQAERVLATVKSWVDRSRERMAFREKEGRHLSAGNRERLKALIEALTDASTDIEQLLAEPAAPTTTGDDSDEVAMSLWLEAQALQADLPALLGQTV